MDLTGQLTANNQKVDGSIVSKATDQSLSFGSSEVIDNEAETVRDAALTKEKEALLKELEELNSLQTNFPTAREKSTQHTL